MAAATVTVQDGNATAVASGNGQNVTPGNTITIALTDTTNVQSWFLRVIWTNGSTSEFSFNANSLTVNQTPTWNATFTAPAEGTGFEFYSEVIATSGAPAVVRFGIYCAGAGDAKVTFPADPATRILALQNPKFQPAGELVVTPGAADPKIQCVATSLAAYTGTGTGTLTGSANGALAAQDGQTLVVGQLIHLPTGLTNVTAADAGPYVVTALGAAGAKYVLTRPGWFAHGSTAQQGQLFEVLAGTLFGGTTWKATAAASVIGTTDAAFYPRQVSQSAVLVSGTVTLTNVPIMSTTKTQILLQRIVANTSTATTGGYCPTVAGANGITAGALGTVSLVIQACVAAGTISASDASTLCVTIINPI